jgi:hypothetical protein
MINVSSSEIFVGSVSPGALMIPNSDFNMLLKFTAVSTSLSVCVS